MKPTEFANLVNAITSAFGDPTRRDIYLLVHNSDEGMTAGEVGEAVKLHTNVARHHLDKLVNGGYLDVSQRSTARAGRPAKVYRASSPELHLEFDVGHDDILVTLLGKVLSRLPADEAAALAEEVGFEFGLKMGAKLSNVEDAHVGQRSFRAALSAAADALSAHGFAAHAERRGDELRIVSGHCPFGDVAIEHPVICAVDRGMVRGLLSALYGDTEVALAASMALGDDMCVTDIQRPA